MRQWIWIELPDVRAIHDAQLSEHGGAEGIRDEGGLESALARPQNVLAYGDPDAAALAAAYAFSIAKNHPFDDGNKRTAFVALEFFLVLNGYTLTADDVQCVLGMLGVAESSVSETELADWIRANLVQT